MVLVKVVGNNNDKITLLRDKYNAWVYVGTLTSVDSSNITINMTAADKSASDPAPTSTGNSDVQFTKLTTDYSSLLGQKVKVMFTDGKNNAVLGVYATDDNTVYTVNANAVDTDGAKVKFNGVSYSLKTNTSDDMTVNDKIKVYITEFDGDKATYTASANVKDSSYFNDLDQSADVMTFIDSDTDGKLDTVIVTDYTAAKVTYASSTQIVAGGETYKFSDESIASGIAKDDWAVIHYDSYKDCKVIEKATLITGKLTATKEGTLSTKAKYDQYQIDGTWYNAAKDGTNTELKSVKAGDSVEAVAVNGVLYYVKRTSENTNGAISNVAMILGTDTVVGTKKASIALFDGTKKTVDIDSDTKVAMNPGAVYEYSVSGDEYTFTALNTSEKEYYDGFTAYNSNFKDVKNKKNDTIDLNNNTSWKISDNAKVLLYANGDRKLITGKQFKNLTLDDSAAVKAAFVGDMEGLTRVSALAVSVKSLPTNLDTNDNYAYILDDAVKSGNNQVSYPIWTGSQKIDVVEDYSGDLSNRQAGLVIGYKSIDTENSNKIDDVSVKKMNVASIESKSDDNKTLNVLKKDGTSFADNTATFGEHDIADATVIYVNSDNEYKATEEGGNIGVMNGSAVVSEYASTLFLLNGDDFELIVIDVKGKFVDNPYVVDTAAPSLTAGAASGTLTYGSTSNVTIDVTPKNFAVKGGNGSDKDDITNKGVDIVIKDASGADKTATFDTITPVDLTKNDTKATQIITQKADTAAGEYTVEITADGITATSKLVINQKDIASGSLPSYAIGGSVSNTTPVAGNRLSNVTGTITPATNTTAQYEWTVNNKSVAADTIVASGDKLVLKVTLTAEANYKFADPFTATVAKIGTSSAATGTVARVDDSTVTITYAALTVS